MRLSPLLLLLAEVPLAACSSSSFRLAPRARASVFTPPGQFLADKETDVAGIVTVKRVETRWVVRDAARAAIDLLGPADSP